MGKAQEINQYKQHNLFKGPFLWKHTEQANKAQVRKASNWLFTQTSLHATRLPSQQNNIKAEMLNSFFGVINVIFQFS